MGLKLRFSVRWLDVCAGEEKRILRKSALWRLGLTQKRTLAAGAHAKAQPLQVPQTALFRYIAASGKCGATARQIAGHYGKWLNWANALEQPPASLRGGLRQGPQRSVWSLTSRKGAV